ncbi:hypothetical protein R1sor_000364 [Riccia sorocarpa]|uniref:R3H-associated N-terminal domain-containing protein n=1 Tax=Riccia sorocarpa TaxID=122646 RepID=A0ABD3GVY8_9MARC
MALVAGSLHDWLTKSSYVWGRDQTSAVVNRKKARAHRKTSTDGEEHHVPADRENNEAAIKVSKRRYRRWLNDRLLRELAPPLEASEIASLFAPPPWGEKSAVTPLERVTGAGPSPVEDAAGWEPFRHIDMDLQAKFLEAERTRTMKASTTSSKQASAMEAWKQVEHTAREALRRNSQSPLLEIYEEKLLAYLSEIEEGKDDKELVLEVEIPFHRLLLHGLSQFHGLTSRTVLATNGNNSGAEGTSGHLVIHIKKRQSSKPGALCSRTDGRLTEFLREVQHRPQVGLAC